MDTTIAPASLRPTSGPGADDLVASPGAADAGAAAHFQSLMEPSGTPAATDVGASAAVQPVEGPRTLGDKMLGGLQNLSSDLQDTWQSISKVLNDANGTFSTQDMLKVQMSLATMSIQYEMLGKAASRSTQNIDQLVKLQ